MLRVHLRREAVMAADVVSSVVLEEVRADEGGSGKALLLLVVGVLRLAVRFLGHNLIHLVRLRDHRALLCIVVTLVAQYSVRKIWQIALNRVVPTDVIKENVVEWLVLAFLALRLHESKGLSHRRLSGTLLLRIGRLTR